MARQSSALEVTGKIGNLSFYHHRIYGYLVRRKGGPSPKQLARDPQFERARENASEFGAASSAGRQIRHAIRATLRLSGDATVTQRLTSLLSKRIVPLDTVNVRGARRVAAGLEGPEGMALLCAFPFHEDRGPDHILYKRPHYSPETGGLLLAGLNPVRDLSAPPAATHAGLQCVTVFFDFAADTYTSFVSQQATLALDDAATDLELLPATLPSGTGTKLLVLGIVFLQEINGERYVLTEGAGIRVVDTGAF